MEQNPDHYFDQKLRESVYHAYIFDDRFQHQSAEFDGLSYVGSDSSATMGGQSVEELDIENSFPKVINRLFDQRNIKPKRTLHPIAEWEGYVETITGDEFSVILVNISSNSSMPTDQAIFSRDDISDNDFQLLRIGAIVRWIIGRERLPTGQVRKVSKLYFRRLPPHTESDYKRAYSKAKALLDSVIWEDETES